MGFIDTSRLKITERVPGWKGRYFDSATMTFGHYIFQAGSAIHRHSHPNEEVWTVLEGQLEVTVGEESIVAGPGCVALVPPNTLHSVKAICSGKAIVVDCPRRPDMYRQARPQTK